MQKLHKRVMQKKLTLPTINMPNVEEPKASYTYEEFYIFDGKELIEALYRRLLDREPDPQGLAHYQAKLAQGATKLEIITAIASSAEARQKGVRLLGLKKRKLVAALMRLPLIGTLFRKLFLLFHPQEIALLASRQRRLEQTLRHMLEQLNHVLQSQTTTNHRLYDTLQVHQKDLDGLRRYLAIAHERLERIEPKTDLPLLYEAPFALQTNPQKEFAILHPRDEEERYIAFENHFYNHALVRSKQSLYIPYIKELSAQGRWLDLGCGRGEFLSLLQEAGIEAIGVEINQKECELLRQKGFSIICDDLFSFLQNTKKRFRGISMLQVIEHIPPERIPQLIRLLTLRLAPKGMLLIETPNPAFLQAFGTFYIDPTHHRPIPHQLLAFYMHLEGLQNLRLLYSSPKSLSPHIEANYHDYALIGYKS